MKARAQFAASFRSREVDLGWLGRDLCAPAGLEPEEVHRDGLRANHALNRVGRLQLLQERQRAGDAPARLPQVAAEPGGR